MWSLVQHGEGPSVVDPAAAALAEYLWLSGEQSPEIVADLDEILATEIAIGTPWPSGAFAFWMWKLDLLETAPPGTAEFYGWIIMGDYKKSAEFWHGKGIPYEEGLALMHGDEAEQIEAIRIFVRGTLLQLCHRAGLVHPQLWTLPPDPSVALCRSATVIRSCRPSVRYRDTACL